MRKANELAPEHPSVLAKSCDIRAATNVTVSNG